MAESIIGYDFLCFYLYVQVISLQNETGPAFFKRKKKSTFDSVNYLDPYICLKDFMFKITDIPVMRSSDS